MFLVDEQSHAFLALVGDNLLCRERLVADGQTCHVYLSSTFFYKFRETVDVSCRAVVVDADNGIGVFLAQSSYQVVCSFLHLRVCSLHGVQLYAVAVSSCIY